MSTEEQRKQWDYDAELKNRLDSLPGRWDNDGDEPGSWYFVSASGGIRVWGKNAEDLLRRVYNAYGMNG